MIELTDNLQKKAPVLAALACPYNFHISLYTSSDQTKMESGFQAVLAASLSFVIVSLLFAILMFFCKKSKTNNVRAARTTPSPSPNPRSETASFDPSLPYVSLSDLLTATQNFSPNLIIGDGSFGLVYKANLPNNTTVAVKKLSADAFQGFREFRAEMETLGKIHHPNIVKMLGYCASNLDRILIYEYIERGSLDQWLYDASSSSSSGNIKLPLSWDTRLSIIGDVAKGLCFMHNLETPIIHRDIKASNVLLDSEFRAHIADFGLARQMESAHSHVSTQVAGTMGYIPPEYFQGSTIATPMGDVYSFGVLMLEIATGRRPNWPFKEQGMDIRIVEWCTKMVQQNKEMKIIDTAISKEVLKQKQVVEFFRIAMLCIDEAAPKHRPTMNKVVELLDGVSRLE